MLHAPEVVCHGPGDNVCRGICMRPPVWFELYQAKKEYGLTDLSPASMNELFNQLVTNDELFQLYVKYIIA